MKRNTRISKDKKVLGGIPVIKGTRVPVSVVFDNLAAGLTAEETVRSYPSLTVEDVRAIAAEKGRL